MINGTCSVASISVNLNYATRGSNFPWTAWDVRTSFCCICVDRLLEESEPYSYMVPNQVQLQCRLDTRNCGCQLPFETFSTRTSTRSSRPMLPSSRAHVLSWCGAPSESAVCLFPLCTIDMRKHPSNAQEARFLRERGWSYLRLSESEYSLGDFVRQLLSAYRLLYTSRVEDPDLWVMNGCCRL